MVHIITAKMSNSIDFCGKRYGRCQKCDQLILRLSVSDEYSQYLKNESVQLQDTLEKSLFDTEQKEREYENLQEQMLCLVTQNEELMTENKRLTSNGVEVYKEKLKNADRQHRQDIDNLNQRNNKLLKDIKASKKQLKDVQDANLIDEKRLHNIIEEKKITDERVGRLLKAKEKAESVVIRLSDMNTKSQRQMEDLQREKDENDRSVQSQIERLTSVASGYQNHINFLTTKIDQLESTAGKLVGQDSSEYYENRMNEYYENRMKENADTIAELRQELKEIRESEKALIDTATAWQDMNKLQKTGASITMILNKSCVCLLEDERIPVDMIHCLYPSGKTDIFRMTLLKLMKAKAELSF